MRSETDHFTVKTNDLDCTITLTYDRWGGMKIVKQDQADAYGSKKYQEIYLPKEAMFALALSILKDKR